MYNYMGRCRYPVLDPTNHHVNTILVLQKSGQDDGQVSPLGGDDAPFACDLDILHQQPQAHGPLMTSLANPMSFFLAPMPIPLLQKLFVETP